MKNGLLELTDDGCWDDNASNAKSLTLTANSGFHITQKWSATWATTYDIVRRQFASNVVNLSRELHDWRANFGYTAAPNGNSAFTFFIALKAQPDLSFPYNRQTTRAAR